MAKTVTVTRQLKASPDRVFRAWTDPEEVKRWFKPTRVIMDARVDGLWHSDTEWEGKRWPHYGRFTQVERPRLCEQTWMSEATHGIETVVLTGRVGRASSRLSTTWADPTPPTRRRGATPGCGSARDCSMKLTPWPRGTGKSRKPSFPRAQSPSSRRWSHSSPPCGWRSTP